MDETTYSKSILQKVAWVQEFEQSHLLGRGFLLDISKFIKK